MSHATRSAATILLALVLALVALVALSTPQGSDDARRKITLGPSVTVSVDQVASANGL